MLNALTIDLSRIDGHLKGGFQNISMKVGWTLKRGYLEYIYEDWMETKQGYITLDLLRIY